MKKYIIRLPFTFADSDGYPSTLLALSTEDNETVYVVNNDEAEAMDSGDDWGYTILFPEDMKNTLQIMFNNSLFEEEVEEV